MLRSIKPVITRYFQRKNLIHERVRCVDRSFSITRFRNCKTQKIYNERENWDQPIVEPKHPRFTEKTCRIHVEDQIPKKKVFKSRRKQSEIKPVKIDNRIAVKFFKNIPLDEFAQRLNKTTGKY